MSIDKLEALDLTDLTVLKRDGSREQVDLQRISKMVEMACEGVPGVSQSAIEVNFRIRMYDGIKTEEIQKALIQTVSDMITETTPNYDLPAGRLAMSDLRKKVYGSFQPLSLLQILQRGVSAGFYNPELLERYSEEEINLFDGRINWASELNMTHIQVHTWAGKYLVRNRETGVIYDTPASAVMMMCMEAFLEVPSPEARIQEVLEAYDHYPFLSWPTPVNAGLRTRTRQYASCTKIDTGDTMDSICTTYTAMMKYASKRAGIGMNVGRIRATGRPIRGGEAIHTGGVGFIKGHETLMNTVSQGGLRKGAMTVNYPIWHLDVESFLVMKNEKGEDSARARYLDYCIHLNRYLVKRMLNDEPITLFSPEVDPALFDSFYSSDPSAFQEVYERLEKRLAEESHGCEVKGPAPYKVKRGHLNQSFRWAKQVSADALMELFLTERKDTGRIYPMWADQMNAHSPFNDPITMTNLCTEIGLPTVPLESIDSEEGRIALCNLGAINLGRINSEEDIRRACRTAIRMGDAILDRQEYLLPAAREANLDYRPLGIGIINYAYFLAKNKVAYGSPEALNLTHHVMESISYYLLLESVILAEEKGPCRKWKSLKLAEGVLCIDTYCKEVDKLVSDSRLRHDWRGLAERAQVSGVRNATRMTLMPGETSAGAVNATNGIEKTRFFVVDKQSEGSARMAIPGLDKYKKYYSLTWGQDNNEDYLKTVAVMQKFVCQSISASLYYDPSQFKDSLVPMSLLVRENIFLPTLWGIKTLYYCNTLDESGDDGSEKEESCDSCKI